MTTNAGTARTKKSTVPLQTIAQCTHVAMPQKSKTAAVTVPDFVAGVGKVNKRGRAKVVITPLDGYAAATNVAWVTLTSVLIAYTVRTFVHPVVNGDIVNPS